MRDITPNEQIEVLETFMKIADHEHSVGHAKAAREADLTKRPFVPEEHWAWAASKARELAREIRETGSTIQELFLVHTVGSAADAE